MAKISKKKKKVDSEGIAFIKASLNNTIITLCDKFGNAITWASAGELGFRGSRKSTPFAATQAATKAAESAMSMGLVTVEVRVKGPGGGREAYHLRAQSGEQLCCEVFLIELFESAGKKVDALF